MTMGYWPQLFGCEEITAGSSYESTTLEVNLPMLSIRGSEGSKCQERTPGVLADHTNTCRPDNRDCVSQSCAIGNDCEYNNQGQTEPHY